MSYSIKIPASFEDVTIGQFMAYKAATNEWEKVAALTGEPTQKLFKLKMSAITELAQICSDVMEVHTHTFKPVLTIKGTDFGFEPNLSQIIAGVYAEAATFCLPANFDSSLAKIMALFYRPITKRLGKKYDIEPYDNSKHMPNAELFMTQSASILGGVLDFFTVLKKNLNETSLQYFEEQLSKTKMELEMMKKRSKAK